MSSFPTVELRDGTAIPLLGLGTYGLKGTGGVTAIAEAAQMGFRLIDTAAQYANEASVGAGVKASGIAREEFLITSKVAGGDQGRENTRVAVTESLRRLGLDYLDFMLIHWPNPSRGLAVETFGELLKMRDEGLIRFVGTSNFRPEQLDELRQECGEYPTLNQIQFNPALPRAEAVAYHREHGIVTEAWGPLGFREGLMDQFVLRTIAERHGKTPAQVALRFAVQQAVVAIPKSSKGPRLKENTDIFDFELSAQDLELLRSLDLGESAAWDSREHEEW